MEMGIDEMREDLPYGIWLVSDGTEILFNRDRDPMYQRSPGGTARPCMLNKKQVLPVTERLFYDDNCTPWNSDVTLAQCFRALSHFIVGEEISWNI